MLNIACASVQYEKSMAYSSDGIQISAYLFEMWS